MAARNQQLRPTTGFVYLHQIDAQSLIQAQVLGGYLLAGRHDGLGTAELEHDTAVVNAGNFADHQFANVVDIAVKYQRALGLTKREQHRLAGLLGRDATEVTWSYVYLDDVAELKLSVDGDGFLQ